MGSSRLEVNISRLLSQCETLGKESLQDNWRLGKYIQALEAMLTDLQKRPNKPEKETMNEYIHRIDILKRLTESQKMTNPVEKAVAVQMMSSGVVTSFDNASRELHQKAASKYDTEIRQHLYKAEKVGGDELRQRNQEKSSGEDLDALLKYHHNMQEKIAEDMLLLARSLKEQSLLAGDIIKRDTETVQKSTKQADENFAKLKLESVRLEEHSRRAWKCWLWVLIVIVMVIFVNMVLFMKVTKKRS